MEPTAFGFGVGKISTQIARIEKIDFECQLLQYLAFGKSILGFGAIRVNPSRPQFEPVTKNSPSRNSPPKIHLPNFNPEIGPLFVVLDILTHAVWIMTHAHRIAGESNRTIQLIPLKSGCRKGGCNKRSVCKRKRTQMNARKRRQTQISGSLHRGPKRR